MDVVAELLSIMYVCMYVCVCVCIELYWCAYVFGCVCVWVSILFETITFLASVLLVRSHRTGWSLKEKWT